MSRHDKDYNSSVKLSAYADLMLDRIDTCINDKISKNVTRLASAIVTKVNSDGSVNIRLPSEDNTEFTKIQNQCPYELKIGDAVELTLKNGSFNNCWVSARHGMGTRATGEGSSGSYVLPVATATQLGGIKVGAGLVISNGVLSVTGGGTADAVEWKNVLTTPTTLAGYGITDARINSGTITLGGNSIVPLTASSSLDATKLVGNVPSATKATQDSMGNVIVDTYAKKTEIPSLSGYATQSWVKNQGYLTEHQSLANYALKTEIPTIPTKVSSFENDVGYLTSHQSLADYATKSWVQNQGYLTTHQDISGLATKLELKTVEDKIPIIPTKVSAFENDAGYLTQHQSLANYALKSELPKNVSELDNDAKYITISEVPVQSINGKTGIVNLTAADVGALSSDTAIPVVNNGQITIQKNGENVKTFGLNDSTNSIINIEVPTAVSELENDKGYLTSVPVTSVNGKTGEVQLSAADIGALPDTTSIPVVNNTIITLKDSVSDAELGNFSTNTSTAKTINIPIPVVNNGKITIQKNGENAGSFSLNDSVNTAINITVPTKTSDLSNDSGYLTSVPVTSVNNKTGEVTLTPSDVGALSTAGGSLTGSLDIKNSAGDSAVSLNTDGLIKGNKIQLTGLAESENALTSFITKDETGVLQTRNAAQVIEDLNVATKNDLPAVNNGKLTVNIKKGTDTSSKTFSANQSADETVDIEIPVVQKVLVGSDTEVPSANAVINALSSSGYGDMMKSSYAPNSNDTVEKAFKDENGNNIASTYIPKFKLLSNTDANSLTTSSICVIGTGNTNLPDEATGSVLFVAGDGTNAFQIIVIYATNTLNHRAYKDGAWTIWRNTEAKVSADSAANFDAYGIGFITGE